MLQVVPDGRSRTKPHEASDERALGAGDAAYTESMETGKRMFGISETPLTQEGMNLGTVITPIIKGAA